jgi:hypothetical protein
MNFWDRTDHLPARKLPLYPKGDRETVLLLSETGLLRVFKPARYIIPMLPDISYNRLEGFQEKAEEHGFQILRILGAFGYYGFAAQRELTERA